MSISMQHIKLHQMKMALKSHFTTSQGSFQQKDFYIVEVIDQLGVSGFGESVAFTVPWYTEETFKTTFHIMVDILIPLLREHPCTHPKEVAKIFKKVKRNHMAKAAIESAVWDLYAKMKHIPLWQALGGVRKRIEVGVSLGMEENRNILLQKIESCLAQGYKRVKIKIKPGEDVQLLKAIRKEYPSIPLMVDANSAYSLNDLPHLQRLDEFGLLMIEQPLGDEDIIEHRTLQQSMETPICLDESIHSFEDARLAVELGSCKVINIKFGRVGGLTEAIRIHDLCKKEDIVVWCGGMLEAGIGRAHNIALSTLTQFTLPGDVSASSRYFNQDIISPEVTVNHGVIGVPDQEGIGYELDEDAFQTYLQKTTVYSL